jgi:uncharacterized RDD family membrane protein YckC
MKCPKCGYLGFEDLERCRNCGYDFSLALSEYVPELKLRAPAATPNPLDDLTLIDAASAAAEPRVALADAEPEPDRGAAPARPSASNDLPLFTGPSPSPNPVNPAHPVNPANPVSALSDEPLITRASPPRPPLAVRRATPEIPRLREDQPRPQPLDLGLDLEVPSAEDPEIFSPAARANIEDWPAERPERPEDAAVSSRFVAVLIDLVILSAIDLIVIYFTMQICGLTLDDLGMLPRGPLVAFLIVQNGGYLVTFTAGGQTLGKMATGIRVVATESAGTLDVGRAVTRTIVWILLAIPAGLGFLTLFSRDNRGLHDRFAGTRVVRASA